jgi:hypothetical protein
VESLIWMCPRPFMLWPHLLCCKQSRFVHAQVAHVAERHRHAGLWWLQRCRGVVRKDAIFSGSMNVVSGDSASGLTQDLKPGVVTRRAFSLELE